MGVLRSSADMRMSSSVSNCLSRPALRIAYPPAVPTAPPAA
jgi:hypothetical protein